MFQLRDQVHQQRVMNLTRGFLSFYDCMVKVEDVRALMDHVALCTSKGFYLRHITFEFCRFHEHDGTLEALQEFFQTTDTIRSISFVKNRLSNQDIARVLQGAHNTELMIILPGGTASLHHRHEIVHSCHARVEKLFLDYKGAVNFAALDDDMVATLSKLQCLQLMRLDGWTMTDSSFSKLVWGIRSMATLKSLHIGRIRGLTTASLIELGRLGVNQSIPSSTSSRDNLHNHYTQQQPLDQYGLDELCISMIPSLFVVMDHDQETSSSTSDTTATANTAQDNEEAIMMTTPPTTTKFFEELFRRLAIRQVSIQESRLNHNVVQAIFRGLAAQRDQADDQQQVTSANNKKDPQELQLRQRRAQQLPQLQPEGQHCGISVFRLKAWSFTEGEFTQLLQSLPHMKLSKLDVSQGGIDVSSRQDDILKALRPNLCLRELDLSYRGVTLNASTHAPLGSLLKRNRNLRMVHNILQFYPSGRLDILDKLAISKLVQESNEDTTKNNNNRSSSNNNNKLGSNHKSKNQTNNNNGTTHHNHDVAALDALYLLLNHRILEAAI